MTESEAKDEITLDYEIANSYWTCGEGNINSIIKSDAGFWKSYIGTDRVKIKCKFKKICRSITVEFKIAHVSMVELTTYFNKEEISNQMEFVKNKQHQSKQNIKHKFKQDDKEIDQVQLDFHCHNKKQIQIYSIKFFGIPLRNKVVQSNSKIINFEIFEERQKRKVEQLNKNAKNKSKQQKSKQQEKKIKNEETQQKKQRKQNKNKQLSIVVPEGFDQDDLMDVQEQERQSCYKKIIVDEEDLQNIMGVTEQWLEAQKKLQANFGVRVQDRLSIKINPKCFINMKFCLPNIYGEQKSKYVRMIKQLGGLVRQDLQQDCIVATPRPKGKLVGIARIKVGVTIVKLHYIDECHKLKTKLNFNKYFFDPLDFIVA